MTQTSAAPCTTCGAPFGTHLPLCARQLEPFQQTAQRELRDLAHLLELGAGLDQLQQLHQLDAHHPGPQPIRLWVAHRSADHWGADTTARGAQAAYEAAHPPIDGEPIPELAYDRVAAPASTTVEELDAFVQRWLNGLYSFYRGPAAPTTDRTPS